MRALLNRHGHRHMALLPLIAFALAIPGCSKKATETDETGQAANEQSESGRLTRVDPDNPEPPPAIPAEFTAWLKSKDSLDAAICRQSRPDGLDDYATCAVKAAAERCERPDWCFIDCIVRDMGKHAGGGCSHLCYSRGPVAPPDGECLEMPDL